MAVHVVMRMEKPPMTTDVLTLVQMMSPSFPVGAFAYSHGLETAINEDLITDRESLQDWLADLLRFGGARTDAVLLTVAFKANAADVQMIDDTARAFAATQERLMETDLQGTAFCDTVAKVWSIKLGSLTYPVAVGRAANALTLGPELTAALYLQAFVGNLCSAAMRLVPLGQTDGQLVQLALKPLCLSIASNVQDATLNDLHSCTFMSDIMSMNHEIQHSRVFRT